MELEQQVCFPFEKVNKICGMVVGMEKKAHKDIPKKRWILRYPQKILFDCACAFILLLIVDTVIRFQYAEEPGARGKQFSFFSQGTWILQGIPILFWVCSRGLGARSGGSYQFTWLARWGYRDSKPANTLRFMTIGDSSVFGFVPEAAVFHKPQRIGSTRSTPNIEAINGAIPGYSTFQSINLLRLRTWKTEPDVLIVASIWSDNNYGSFIDKEVIATKMDFDSSGGSKLQKVLSFSAFYRVADWRMRIADRAEKIKSVGQSIYMQESVESGGEINDYANLETLISSAHERYRGTLWCWPMRMTSSMAWILFKLEPYREVMRNTASRHGIPLLWLISFRSGHTSTENFWIRYIPVFWGIGCRRGGCKKFWRLSEGDRLEEGNEASSVWWFLW